MAAYRRVYDSHHLQADCQEPGSAPEPYACPIHWAGGIMFTSCPSVCACVHKCVSARRVKALSDWLAVNFLF